jgi:GT2 family glycosyltransferase
MISIDCGNVSTNDRAPSWKGREVADLGTRRTDPRVAVIILHWNRPNDTLACLRSLALSDYPQLHVILVDNGSAADALTRVRAEAAGITIIENGINLGFAGGNNVGIKRALTERADYVLLLNDDTEVAPDLVRRLVETAEADPAVGIVGPTIYYFEPGDTVWSAGGMVDPSGVPYHLGVDQAVDQVERARDVDYVTGCAILVKREVIEKVGPLDERFFAYFEETEWCARSRGAGYRVCHEPNARMWHKIGPDARQSSPVYLYLMTRNRLLYLTCRGASRSTIARATVNIVRSVVSWQLRPHHRGMRPFAGAAILGLRDFFLGRFGPPPARLLAKHRS